jgi:hypothetical protein
VAGEQLGGRFPGAAPRELNEPGVAAHPHEHIVVRATPRFASLRPTFLRGFQSAKPRLTPPPLGGASTRLPRRRR